jgi:light-regulated signal transduction histidine kinase (bacteriophytochrome)
MLNKTNKIQNALIKEDFMTPIMNSEQETAHEIAKPDIEPAGKAQEPDNISLENKVLADKLENITKEMNQFTYIVSHDLQAPLRTITGFLELLEKRYAEKLDDTAKQFISYAVRGASKMKSLVFDLLEYSRLSSVAPEITEVDMNTVVQEVKEKFSVAIEESGALLTVGHLPLVMANKKQMSQLIEHLIGNALKFQGAAPPEISISSKEENACLPDKQVFWVIAVKDNGIGIDQAFFEKIFIVFRRLSSDEIKYGGTGIGLAISKKIAELHGGTIWVESEAGKGSTFYFTLPVKS